VLNAANEVAVAAFLDDRLAFTGIPAVIRQTMDEYERRPGLAVTGLEAVRSIDAWAREFAARTAREVQSMS
jgi:1-deoxy-D-xylulose-5-phosphate reductoisomerase